MGCTAVVGGDHCQHLGQVIFHHQPKVIVEGDKNDDMGMGHALQQRCGQCPRTLHLDQKAGDGIY